MDHTGLLNGPSPYADTAEAPPLGIEYQVSSEQFQSSCPEQILTKWTLLPPGRQSLRPRAKCVKIWTGPARGSARHDVVHGAEQAAVGHYAAAAATTTAPHSTA